MPRHRPPAPPDPERLSTMLAAGRRARVAEARGAAASGMEPKGAGRGWVPQGSPPDADTSWLDDEWTIGVPDDGLPGATAAATQGAEPVASGRHRSGPRVLTVPTPFRGAQVRVPWRAVVALAVVLLVSGLFFAVRVARAQEVAAPQVVPAGGGLVARTAAPSGFGSGTTSVAGATPTGAVTGPPRQLVVDVVGQVVRPGVVSVPEGARVGDVLAAAGGALAGADVHRLNLARVVADGEQVVVPKPGETLPEPWGTVGGGGAGPGATTTSPVVDLNTANLSVLDGLPGVGPVLAQRIIDWRAEHGRFSSVDELGEVSGIGDKLLSQIRAKVRV